MRHLNCIVVFDSDKENILFCKRMKEPYMGLYNFPGGKVELGETSFAAAYRELMEETGILKADIQLYHFMDLTYYEQDFVLELYVGQLREPINVVEEINPLCWLPLTENFNDVSKYAGNQNLAHIIDVALHYPLDRKSKMDVGSCSLGIDGCKDGWIVAKIKDGCLEVFRFSSLVEIVDRILFDACIIDMIIGLQDGEDDIRPDSYARREMKGRASTIFPAPCRKAVYGDTKTERLAYNEEVLGKKFTSQTDAIIPKIREVDEFLQDNSMYKNMIEESHPEVCFARLNGSVLMSSKHTEEGIRDRARVLSGYLPQISFDYITETASRLRCNADDIADAVCLAVVGNLKKTNKTETIPDVPMKDRTGLYMQMVVPKRAALP